jgi:MFS family permease
MSPPRAPASPHDAHHPGIRRNLHQFVWQALQVALVGLVIGMERNVLPVVASHDFGVPPRSFVYLMAFVISFGLVKGALNFVAGRLSEQIGRKPVLLMGWVAAIPIPLLIYFAPNWWWIVAANLFLGINQGFAWSMTVTSKVDITRAEQRGLATGINEFAGYAAVGLAGIATGYLSHRYGPRPALLWFALAVIAAGLATAALFVRETLPWARAESHRHAQRQHAGPPPRFAQGLPAQPDSRAVFAFVSFRHPTFGALCQAGVANKVATRCCGCCFRCTCTSEAWGWWRLAGSPAPIRPGVGRLAVVDRPAVGPHRAQAAGGRRPVAAGGGRGDGAAGAHDGGMAGRGDRDGAGHGAAVSQPDRRRGRHRPPGLAQLRAGHLSLLA